MTTKTMNSLSCFSGASGEVARYRRPKSAASETPETTVPEELHQLALSRAEEEFPRQAAERGHGLLPEDLRLRGADRTNSML